MKKPKRKIIFLVLLILLFLLLLFFQGGSYSKYLTQVDGKGIIEVAKWAFLVNGQTASITPLNLASTYKKETLKQNTIAPGTNGSFNIEIDASGSEVGINYDVKFQNETSKPQNLQFTYDGHTVNSVKDLEQYLEGTIAANASEKTKTMTILWNWPYETQGNRTQEDAQDTNDGTLLEQYSFNIVITGTQETPQSV